VVDELIIRFTHTREMPFWLPGIGATGRVVEIPLVVVMGFEKGSVSSEHIYWDQAGLLEQIGLLEGTGLPIAGAQQARALRDRNTPLNDLIKNMQ
jgi:carboxymethylenebutenolidase